MQTSTDTRKGVADIFITLQDWVTYLLSKWWILVLAGVLGGICGIGYAFLQKPKYEAKLTFSLEDNGGGMGGALSLAAEFGFNLGGSGKDIFSGDNILTILTSRRMIEQVLLSVDTVKGKPVTIADYFMLIGREEPPFKNHPRLSKVSFPAGQSREKFSYLQDSILYTLFDNISKGSLFVGKPDKKLNYYQVIFIGGEERFCKIFVERLLKATTDFYTEMRVKRSRETVEILEKRVEAMRGSAKSAIQGRASIQDANVNPAFATQGAQLQEKQLDASAYGGAYGELFKNLELARYQYLKDIPLLQVIDEPRYPMKNLKKGKMKSGILWGFISGFLVLGVLILRRLIKKANPGL